MDGVLSVSEQEGIVDPEKEMWSLGHGAERLTGGSDSVVTAELDQCGPGGGWSPARGAEKVMGGKAVEGAGDHSLEVWLWRENRETGQQLPGEEGIRKVWFGFGFVLFACFSFFFNGLKLALLCGCVFMLCVLCIRF